MTTRSPSAGDGIEPRSAPLVRGSIGLLLVLAGGLGLGALIYFSNSRAPAAEHAMISLGLAGSVLVSAIAQSLVIVGLWQIWRAARRAR